jgi:hypothetical protein
LVVVVTSLAYPLPFSSTREEIDSTSFPAHRERHTQLLLEKEEKYG